MSQLRRLSLVLVVASAVICGGCATVKRLLPWGGDGGESADAATTAVGSTEASTEAKADDPIANNPVGNSNTGNDANASTVAAPADDQRGTGKLDLTVPAPATQPSGAGPSVATSAAASNPAASATSSDDAPPLGWAAVVHDAIQRNWLRPTGPQIPSAFSCDVLVKLTRSGIVEDAQVTRSCGHPSLDASVISAVQAASPLPLPSDVDEFSDTLLLTFSP